MKQALGGVSTPDRHYVTRLSGHRSSALAYNLRTAAATFSYTSAEELLQHRPVQPSLQDVVFRDPPAVLQTALSSNGNGTRRRRRVQQQEVQQLLPLASGSSHTARPGQQLQQASCSQNVQQPDQPLCHSSSDTVGSHSSESREKQPTKQQQQHDTGHPDAGTAEQHPLQQQDAARVQRRWSSMRNWQWLASQQQCTGRSSSSLQDLVNVITQLSQPGVAPSQYDKQQQQGFNMFLAQLLQATTQQLQQLVLISSSNSPDQQSSVGAAAVASDVTDLLWGLAKLKVQPQWPQQQQQQAAEAVPRSPAVAAALLARQRTAETVDAAVSCIQQQLQQQHFYSPRQLALCGWALAKLQYTAAAHHPQFWQQYLSEVQQQLPAFSKQDLSNVVWALTKVQHIPDSAWTTSFLAAAHNVLCHYDSSSSSSGQATAVIMLSLAQLEVTPAADWIDDVLLSMLQQRQVGRQVGQQQGVWQQQQQQQQQPEGVMLQYDGYALACVLGAVAKWGHVPEQHWMRAAQVTVQQQLGKCSGQDIAQFGWALATITAAAASAAEAAAAAPLLAAVSSDSSSGSSSWDYNQQEPGLVMLRRQLLLNNSGSSCQDLVQQQQQQVLGHVDPELLQHMSQRLAEAARSTDPHQVVLGMWAITKLHQLSEQSSLGSSSSSTGSKGFCAGGSEHHSSQVHLQQQYQSNGKVYESQYSGLGNGMPQQQQQQYAAAEAAQQRRQQRLQWQQWQQCRNTLLHCVSVLDQQHSFQLLDCKHLAMLVWSLAAAGGQVDTDQQQQQQSPIVHNPSSNRRPRTSSGFSVPQQCVQQIVSASRDKLAAGDSQSQALLLRGLINLGAQPSWQWLLRFYEATEPQLDRSSAKDLSMMAGALAQLKLRPLGSWLARFLQASKALAESQGFDAECLVTVVAAVAGPSWGLVGAAVTAAGSVQKAAQQQGQQMEAIAPGWQAAMQQQLLLLLPKLSLLQVSAMLRASAALQWSLSSPACVCSMLSRALQITQHHSGTARPQQQQQQQQVVEVLQVLAAAAVLSGSTVAHTWWCQMAGHLSTRLRRIQQLGTVTLTPEQLCAGIRILSAVLRKQQQWQLLVTCLQQLITAAAQQAPQLSVDQSLQLLSSAHRSLRAVRCVRQKLDQVTCLGPDSQAADSMGPDNQTAWGPFSQAGCAAAAADRASCQAEDQQKLCAAVQELSTAVQHVLVQQVPHMSLQQVASVLSVASECGLLLPVQQGAGADTAAGPSPLLLAGLSVIGQQLQLIEQLQQQAVQQHLQQQEQQRQHPMQRPVVGPMLQRPPGNHQQQHPGHAAGDLATILVAFARCGYHPGSKLLRRMLQQVQLGMYSLNAKQLCDVAAAAAALQLGRLLGPGFRAQYWMVLSSAFRRAPVHPVVPAVSAAVAGTCKQPSRSGMPIQAHIVQRHRAHMLQVTGCGCSYSSIVFHGVKALHDLTVPHVQHILAQQHHSSCGASSSSSPLQGFGTRSARGLGAPPPRLLVERAFSAAAAVWPGLVNSHRSQQQPATHLRQLQLLRMLLPLASRLSGRGLKRFTLVVGPQLKQLPGPERREAWAVFRQLLATWRVGKADRQRLVELQQQRRHLKMQGTHEQAGEVFDLANTTAAGWAFEDRKPQQPAVVTIV